MTNEQKTVAIGAASGILGMLISLSAITTLLPTPAIADTLGARIAFAFQMNLIAILPLFIMFVTIGNKRFTSEAIDPLRHAESSDMEIDARVVSNTLEQQVIFIVATLALSTLISYAHLGLLTAAAIVYVFARTLFWIGYHKHPLLRAPGMAATGYLNLFLILYTLYLFLFG